MPLLFSAQSCDDLTFYDLDLRATVVLDVVRRGGMAEWFKAAVLKTVEPERVPGVRIPLPPPNIEVPLGTTV